MSIWDRLWRRGEEQRMSPENPAIPVSAANFVQIMGWSQTAASGVIVTIDNALGVPGVWSAVNFMSGTLAGLPFNHFKRTTKGNEKQNGQLQQIMHDAVNDGMSSFDWRKYVFDQVFTVGRSLTYIERNGAGKVANLWPMDQSRVVVQRTNGRKVYLYRDGDVTKSYDPTEIIDIPFTLAQDQLTHRSPIMTNRDVIGLAIAATNYGSKFFQNGGVPPFVLTGPMGSPAALRRASDDLEQAVKQHIKEPRLALAIPAGHDIKPIGADPEKSQLVELQRFIIEQIARIYSLPPVFLQDLSKGTFANTEQQDLFFVKHTLTRWAEQFEQEINLKLFGRGSSQYVELNLDGLLRGDFKTRMDGYAQGIQNGVLMPNEARAKENLPADPEGDKLYMQAQMVALGTDPEPDGQELPEPGDPGDKPQGKAK